MAEFIFWFFCTAKILGCRNLCGWRSAATPPAADIRTDKLMSAFGPKRTCVAALHESAIGGKADMTIGTCPLSWSLLGVKRTWVGALHMSAFDPKRTRRTSVRTRRENVRRRLKPVHGPRCM